MPNMPNNDSLVTGSIRLGDIAHARSGDKGSHANVGVIAWTDAGYEFLKRELTAERVAAFFAPLAPADVARYELPGIRAINFVLFDALDGGGSRSLRTDSQGKTFGLALLELELACPDEIDAMRP